MPNNEGISETMNAVLYYSNTGESKRIAEYIADKTGYALTDITAVKEYAYEYAVLVFPVYCQNVPQAADKFLPRLQAEHLVTIATYGKMSYGNVLNEIQRRYAHRIIAAAYVPTKHAYLNEPRFDDFEKLAPLLDKLKSPTAVTIPKSHKNPLSNFAPAWRSRQGVKIIRSEACNGCGECERNCPEQAIQNGKPNRKCIRCLRCVESCPQKALSVKLRSPLRNYLKKPKTTDLIIYV